jgi:hypothetical protein
VLIPLVGFLIACTVFACVGAALLSLIPKLRLTVGNVLLFVIGAVPTAAISAVLYGRVFGTETGELTPPAVLGLWAVLFVAGICGGLLTLLLCRCLSWGLQRVSGR